MKKPELLMPAGDFNTLKIAYNYGADACYIGGNFFSLRANATNFSDEELEVAIKYAHSIKKKIYITANIFAFNDDLEKIREYFLYLNKIKPNGVLISDLGVLRIANEILTDVDIHISTQANTTNLSAVLFYRDLGVKRVVLARELSMKDIEFIKSKVKDSIEIETFIHGSMCISFSGRCLLSNFLTGKSSNLGECTHPCRWKYEIQNKEFEFIEETRRDEKYTIVENERGSYIFNSKDLCMIEHIDDLINANIDSLKVEGRMKSELYIATIARVYRKAIDDYVNDKELYKNNKDIYIDEIKKCTYREYTTGFFYGKPDEKTQVYDESTYINGAKLCGIVEKVDDDFSYFTQKNKFSVDDELEVMDKNFENRKVKVLEMFDVDTGKSITTCPHSKQKLKVRFDNKVDVGLVLRIV